MGITPEPATAATTSLPKARELAMIPLL